MDSNQQKAYDWGYNDSKAGKRSLDSTSLIINHYSEISNPNVAGLDKTLFAYYSKGYNQYITDSKKVTVVTDNPTDYSPVITSPSSVATIDYDAVVNSAYQSIMNIAPGASDKDIVNAYAHKYVDSHPGITSDALKSELMSKIKLTKDRGYSFGLFNVAFMLATTGTMLSSPVTVTPGTLVQAAPTTLSGPVFEPGTLIRVGTTTPAASDFQTITNVVQTPTVTPVEDTSSVFEPTYNPVIPVSSTTSMPAVSTQTTGTPAASQTLLAGISSNIWLIVLIVGAFIGMLFFGGKK